MLNRILLSVMLVVTFTGCLEELGDLDKEFNAEISPTLAVPIIDSKIYVQDFSDDVDDVLISSDPDGTIVISYEDQFFNEVADAYYNVPDQSSPIVTITSLSSGGVPLTGDIQASESDILVIQPENGERLDLLRLKGGTLRFVVNSTYTVNGSVTLSIPNLLISGVPFSESISISPGSNQVDYDLSNSLLNLVLGGSDFNQLAYDVDLVLSANGDIVLPAQSIQTYFTILNPDFSLMIGEADYRLLDTQTGNKPIDVLNNLTFDQFSLEEPSLEITVSNSFGVPFELDVASLSLKDRAGVNYNLTGDIIDNTTTINAPAESEIGSSVSTVIDINSTNSNISDFLSQIPTDISYDASVAYPGGTNKIFVMDTSKIVVSGKIRLPLYGSLMNLALEKDFAFDGSVFDTALSGTILFDIENRFPLSVGLLVEFYDIQGNKVLDLLTIDPILAEAAPVDGAGRSVSAATKLREIDLSDSDLTALRSSTDIKIFILMETTNNGSVPVRILDSDYIDLKIGIKTELDL